MIHKKKKTKHNKKLTSRLRAKSVIREMYQKWTKASGILMSKIDIIIIKVLIWNHSGIFVMELSLYLT